MNEFSFSPVPHILIKLNLLSHYSYFLKVLYFNMVEIATTVLLPSLHYCIQYILNQLVKGKCYVINAPNLKLKVTKTKKQHCKLLRQKVIKLRKFLKICIIFCILLHIYPSITKKRSMRCTSSVRSCRPSVYHCKMGESRYSQRSCFSTLSL